MTMIKTCGAHSLRRSSSCRMALHAPQHRPTQYSATTRRPMDTNTRYLPTEFQYEWRECPARNGATATHAKKRPASE
jgi:hypothetical protein